MVESTERLKSALRGCYEIERELGRSGMATVFLARDLKHARRVANKVLKPELSATVGGLLKVSSIGRPSRRATSIRGGLISSRRFQ